MVIYRVLDGENLHEGSYCRVHGRKLKNLDELLGKKKF